LAIESTMARRRIADKIANERAVDFEEVDGSDLR